MKKRALVVGTVLLLFSPPALRADPCPSTPGGPQIGLVLSGGGSLGAFQVGALKALFEYWQTAHGALPPIRIVAGTSTGALIAPFALLGKSELDELEFWYTNVENKDILAFSLWNLLVKGVSLSDFGYKLRRNCMRLTHECGRLGGRLYCNYKCALRPKGDDLLQRVGSMWPARRVAVTTIDFRSGTDHVVASSDFTSQPGDDTAFRRAIFASAVPPLIGPPVPLKDAQDMETSPHYDGGVYSEAPFDALFAAAALPECPVEFTHVILLSSWPAFPGQDAGGVQQGEYPPKARLLQIADRFNTVLSEAGATRDLRSAGSALKLRAVGVSVAEVQQITGLAVPGTPKLIVVRPDVRLGWRANRFVQGEMKAMVARGWERGKQVFENTPW
jgi:predicted acylesterase/phospholipase RssA